MTALLAPPADPAQPIWSIGAPRLFAGMAVYPTLDLDAHTAAHGALPLPQLPRLLALLDGARLAGRGGAGFPVATKLRSLRGKARRVVVNGSESEPASGKDRVLLRRAPHLVLDGAAIVAAAIGAPLVEVAVHDPAAAAAVRAAAAERAAADPGAVHVTRTEAAFVGGEARALLRGLDGRAQLPPGRRELPTERGIVVSNAETFAQIAVLARTGARRFAESGTSDEPGTTLLTLGGAVYRPGVVEVPIGTPLGILLEAAGAPPLQAVILGGYHGSWLRPDPSLRLSRRGLADAGGTLGAGVLLAVDQHTCTLGELARVADWLAAESSGQCGPCLFGLPALARDVRELAAGRSAALPEAMRHAQLVTGRGACSHPDGAVRFVTSGLRLLRTEIEAHLAGGCGRTVRGVLPLGTRS